MLASAAGCRICTPIDESLHEETQVSGYLSGTSRPMETSKCKQATLVPEICLFNINEVGS